MIVELLNQVAENLKVGESRLIPCEDKTIQKRLIRTIKQEIAILVDVAPTLGSKLRVYGTFADSRLWVVIEKSATNPLVSYIKDNSGTVQRTKLADPERNRMIRLMAKDGFPLEEIQDLQGQLSDEEIMIFKSSYIPREIVEDNDCV